MTYVPENGFVPDSATAISIAEAVLIPIYGIEEVMRQRPFSAKQVNLEWIVVGSSKPNRLGGVATVLIDRRSGKILRVTHSR